MKLRRTKRGWRFPCGIEIGDHNLATMLGRIPTEERILITSRCSLYPKVRETLARRAARIYTAYWMEAHPTQKFPIDWWTIGGGSHRKNFFKVWYGYENGFMPEDMMACAVALRKAGKAFQFGRAVPVNAAFGPFVLSTLLDGWQLQDMDSDLLKPGGIPVQTPIPLSKAYTGPRADRRMTKSRNPSRVWEPGLVFDGSLGLYVPPEIATADAIDVDAEES